MDNKFKKFLIELKFSRQLSKLQNIPDIFDLGKVSQELVEHYFNLLYRQFEYDTILEIYYYKISENQKSVIVNDYFFKSLIKMHGKSDLDSFIASWTNGKIIKQAKGSKFFERYIAEGEFDFRLRIIAAISKIYKYLRYKFRKIKHNNDFSSDNSIYDFSSYKVTPESWDKHFFLILRHDARETKLYDLLKLHRTMEKLNPDFLFVGSTGIGNSGVLSLAHMLTKYEICQEKAYQTEFSLRLTKQCNDNSRQPFRVSQRYNKVLIISQQGVGDEVRCLGFYHYVNARYVDIVIDPRFESIVDGLERFNYIYYKQFRPGFGQIPNLKIDGLLPRLLPDAVSSTLSQYDLVVTSTELIFSLKSQIKNPVRQYLPNSLSHKNNFGKKIGFIWRSDFVNSKRGKDFLSVIDFEKLFLCFSHVTFIPLVTNIDNAEKKYLSQFNNIQYPDDTYDLYNNFLDVKKYVEELDMIVGISSFILEMASAMNKSVYILSPTAEGFYFRASINGILGKANPDFLSVGSKVVAANSYAQRKSVIADELINNVIKEIYDEIENDN